MPAKEKPRTWQGMGSVVWVVGEPANNVNDHLVVALGYGPLSDAAGSPREWWT